MAPKKPWVKPAFSSLNLTAKATVEASEVPAKRTRSCTKTAESAAKEVSPDAIDLTGNEDDSGKPARTPPPTINNNWMESFAPSDSESLAVHAKKVGEVRDWLRHCESMRKKYPAQICLLTGPSGAGKTATLTVLAKEAGYDIQEWINPTDYEVINALGDQPTGTYIGSQLEAFKSFLLRASRYKSLLMAQHKPLLLVEDFPNVLLTETANNFEELLNEYVSYGKSPLVFIVADTKSRALNLSYKLFTDQLKEKLHITHINFNAIAATIMQKSMSRFCTLMRQQHAALYTVPSQTVLDSIAVCAQGDVRNALINLHFASLKGAPSIVTQQLKTSSSGSSKTRKNKTQRTLKTMGRDESITMMHALGRVLNPKYNESKKLQYCPETLAEAFSTEPKNVTNFIHANYIRHFSDIEDIVPAINDLGIADLMFKEYRDDALGLIGLSIAVRGCMLANKSPVSGWMPVRGPKRIAVQSQTTAAEQKLLGVTLAGISKSLYASDYGSYVRLIATKTNGTPAENAKE